MKILIPDLFQKDHITYDFTREDQINYWVKRAKEALGMNIPMRDIFHQVDLFYEEGLANTKTNYYPRIRPIQFDIADDKEELKDIKSNYADYVEAEKSTIPDSVFERIDRLEAELTKLQAQSEEQAEINSQSKKQAHEG
ncbi:FlxA-like family protein [Reichenbachiella sp.]|uniref:FlxA-like family protein n=1 Tax=Reichenbachiella sp. TaxID=2184521 RepID=UPI0032984DA8